MSGKSIDYNIDDSVSSFSESSIGSGTNTFKSKYQAQLILTQKLEDKIAGYKTVVQQFPKIQGNIERYKAENEKQANTIESYKYKYEEQQQVIQCLKKRLQHFQKIENFQHGLTDLDLCHPTKVAHSQASSSPSFEIIGKSPSSYSSDKDIQNFLHQEAVSSKHSGDAALNSRCPGTLQYQEQNQVFSSASKVVPFERKLPATVYTTGPPKSTLLRGLSLSSAVSEKNTNPTLNISNSYLAAQNGLVSVFTGANKNQVWKVEQEVFASKMELSEPASQSTASSGTLTQATSSLKNSTCSVNPTVTETHTGSSDRGTRPKEWKPLNTMIPEKKENMNYNTWQLSDETAAGKSVPAKLNESSDFHYVSEVDLSPNRNDLSMTEKLTEDTFCTATKSEDLMKFPSLKTNSPSPEQEANKLPLASSLRSNQNSGNALFSADEKPSLASQVENALAKLGKSDSPVEMSDMLYKFAENAKNMESKIKEYKEIIKQQEAHIQQLQCLPSAYQEEIGRLRYENSALKRENETLLEFVAALKMNKDNVIEAGWVSLAPAQAVTEPVRSHYPDSPIMKKIESLSVINAKLFQANKDWHNKWELLRQQTQEEKTELETKVKALETIIEAHRNTISGLESDLLTQNGTVQELIKASNSTEEEKASLARNNESLLVELSSLKSEVKDLRRNKKILESELIEMKNLSRNRDNQHTGNFELRSEIGLLKQQLAVFADDFDKERKDRLLAENKADNLRRELQQIKQVHDTRLKKMNVQIKALESDLRAKVRQNADFLYQVQELKLKLQHEQRKSALASQNVYGYPLQPASFEEPVSLPYNSSINGHITSPGMSGAVNHLFTNASLAQTSYMPHSSPEHLPGAWKCRHCTYVNFPNRSVCDICGYTVSSAESLPIAESGSGINELQSRGQDKKFSDGQDVVVD